MFSLSSWRVSRRMQLLVALTLLGLLVLCLVALFQLQHSLLEDRKQKTKNLVEVAVGVLAYHQKLAQNGTLSEAAAKNAAREALRGLRYEGSDYFFVLDTEHNYILLPPKPETEGQNRREMQDANGKFLIQELVQTARSGGGFVDYWFPRAGQEKAEPKLSYAALFQPWGWVVGTGIYIDDVGIAFRQGALLFGSIALLLLASLALVGWRVSSSILRQLGGEPAAAVAVMQNVAAGDLTAHLSGPAPGSLLHALGGMVLALRELVAEIGKSADHLVSNAEQISHASSEVATAAGHQADATSSMAAAIEEMTVSSNHISDSAHDTEEDSRGAMALAGEGGKRVNEASAAMRAISSTVSDASGRIHALQERAAQVSTIANVIKEIAAQTNLLALNAAIEAARAGEQGRGFAVVADEVRQLAERTAVATTEIEQMIVGIQVDTAGAVEAMSAALPKVDEGVQLADSAAESLREIEHGAHRTLERVREVAGATREQSAASTSIAQRVEQIAQMVEETSSTIRGTAETAERLEEIAVGLRAQIGRFKV
ncbi:methyl-accepting chemotaxis protein [Rhodocyclus gracilis]|uniref:Methyl-accepting chemotaxis protein n=1 Tax=Rhodocyclus tenuis TaxID=1066 RepID=A0A6L5JT53_RHOTE|nr:methyl-accepting chemotaxis protein [Rhodocyclus gracilis]MQY50326.1 methyl-accepting chemotaxis protein [Rhodocyclus gracilis]